MFHVSFILRIGLQVESIPRESPVASSPKRGKQQGFFASGQTYTHIVKYYFIPHLIYYI